MHPPLSGSARPGPAEGSDALVALRLSPEDVRALARQGFVAAHVRGGRTYFKLRWRLDGRQRVRGLGIDPRRAEAVRAALAARRHARAAARELDHLLARARRHLRNAKRLLAPIMAAAGFHYHGFTRRRPAPPGRSP